MRPIRNGDRGPSVEDVQRRLLVLGSDLGPTGVDGVFMGATLAAVRVFQSDHGLTEDGEVGPQTWSALVDATFTLGDRLLYLRSPCLHGVDVMTLQGALNSLGFAAGDADGIFGAFCERAVGEFQANSGLRSDGIVGPDTVRALNNLRHVWAGKTPEAPASLRRSPARQAEALRGRRLVLLPLSDQGSEIAGRLCNLALASEPGADVTVASSGDACAEGELMLILGEAGAQESGGESRVVAASDGGEALARRVETAMCVCSPSPAVIAIGLSESPDDEHSLQRIAVGLLDGLCRGLARTAKTAGL